MRMIHAHDAEASPTHKPVRARSLRPPAAGSGAPATHQERDDGADQEGRLRRFREARRLPDGTLLYAAE